MIKAQAGDIILVSCGTYHESDIQIKPGVALWSGTLQPGCVTIDAQGQGRCLVFSAADSTTSVVGFTLTGGVATEGSGGAVLVTDSSPRITRCVFDANSAPCGGALAATGKGGPHLELCVFRNNSAQSQGGAIFWSSAGGALVGCTLQANDALVSGGALAAVAGHVLIRDCLFQGNSAGNTGGAISLAHAAATMIRTVLEGNTGGLAGGALACVNASPELRQCTLVANDADGEGTVLRLLQADPTFDQCLFTGSLRGLVEQSDSAPVLRQSNIYPSPGAGWPDGLLAQQSQAGNFSADPLYCNPAASDYHLRAGSPCLATTETGVMVGALGQGCGAHFPPDVVE